MRGERLDLGSDYSLLAGVFFEGSSNGVDEGKIALAVMISGDC